MLTGYDGKPYSYGDRVEIHPDVRAQIPGLPQYVTVYATSITPADRVRGQTDDGRVFCGYEKSFKRVK